MDRNRAGLFRPNPLLAERDPLIQANCQCTWCWRYLINGALDEAEAFAFRLCPPEDAWSVTYLRYLLLRRTHLLPCTSWYTALLVLQCFALTFCRYFSTWMALPLFPRWEYLVVQLFLRFIPFQVTIGVLSWFCLADRELQPPQIPFRPIGWLLAFSLWTALRFQILALWRLCRTGWCCWRWTGRYWW